MVLRKLFFTLFAFVAVAANAAWTLDSIEAPTTMTDGNWSLSVSLMNGALTITKGNSGVDTLDLSSVEDDTGFPVTTIAKSAFSGYTTITNFIAPSVISVGSESFKSCSGLTNVVVSSNITSLGEYAFYLCSSLMRFSPTVLPELTYLGRTAFRNSPVVGDFQLAKLESIGNEAFYGTMITSFYAPKLTVLGGLSFAVQKVITNITVSPALNKIGSDAMNGCQALETFYPLNLTNLTALGSYAFSNCNKLKGDFIAPLLTSIGYQTFSACNSLTSFYLPNVKSVDSYSFSNCKSATNFVFHSSPKVGTAAFYCIAPYANIWWIGGTAPTSISEANFIAHDSSWTTIHVSRGKDKENWQSLCTRIPPNLTESDLTREGAPEEPIIGVLNSNRRNAWITRWSNKDPSVITFR